MAETFGMVGGGLALAGVFLVLLVSITVFPPGFRPALVNGLPARWC